MHAAVEALSARPTRLAQPAVEVDIDLAVLIDVAGA
jgi:hypothetical protein